MKVGVIVGIDPLIWTGAAVVASASATPEERQAREERREEALRTGPQRCACGVVTVAGPECRKCKRSSRCK